MNNQCVVGVYASFEKAKDAVQVLEKHDFSSDHVSLVTRSVEKEVPEEEVLQRGDRTEEKALRGAGYGGLLGALVATPLLAIPGVGPVLLAGPIAAGMTGAIVGGFLGAMSGWGVPQDRIQQYEHVVQEGNLLVVAYGDPLEVAEAKRLLEGTDCEEVHLHAATSADKVAEPRRD